MTDETVTELPVLSEPLDPVEALCERAAWLVRNTTGPLKRLHLQAGELTVELEWPAATPAELPGPAVHAAPALPTSRHLEITLDETQQVLPRVDDGSFVVHCPLVGTFYRGPSPDAAPFVAVGQEVAAGQQLAIVEAMKLMNAVEIDRPGIVVDLLVADGSPVEYGDALFVIAPV